MREADFDEFAELLKAAFDLLGKSPAAKIISPTAQALFFQSLASYPLPLVRSALAEHMQRGKFTPVPDDVITLIEAAAGIDNRPGAEEAWALALSTMDDTKTVVWTEEAAEAFGKSRPVLDASGAISARKTFIEIYERLVTANRKHALPAKWFASPGTDQDQRQIAMKAAVVAGQLQAPQRIALPAPEGKKVATTLSPAEQMAAIRSLLTDSIAEKQRKADAEINGRIETEDEFKRDLARRVAQRQAFIAMADQAQVARAEREIVQKAGSQ